MAEEAQAENRVATSRRQGEDEQSTDTSESVDIDVTVGDLEPLLDQATTAIEPTDMVIVDSEAGQRYLQERFREARLPKDAVSLVRTSEIGERVLTAQGQQTANLDRLARLTILRALDESEEDGALAQVVRWDDPESVEQARAIWESMTGWHEARLEAARDVIADLPSVAERQASVHLETALATEQCLRRRQTPVSDIAHVRRGTREIVKSRGKAWESAVPNIERLWMIGTSQLSAAQADLLTAVGEWTNVDLTVVLRRGTGPYMKHRLQGILGVPNPGEVVWS